MTIYSAPKPVEPPNSTIEKLLIAPWGFMKKMINRLSGTALGKLALTAQQIDFTEVQIPDPTLLNTVELRHERHTVVTHDGAALDTIEIQHVSQQALSPVYQKYVISFNCNFKCYEQLIQELQVDAKELETNIIGFNYRGVSQSKSNAYPDIAEVNPTTDHARKFQDLVTDGIAQVQRLLDAGVSAENITLYGLSIGGAVAVFVAYYFYKLGSPINVFNDRSFSTMTNLLVGQIRTMSGEYHTGHSETKANQLVGFLSIPLIKMVLVLSDWEADVANLYKKIPNEYKDYMLIRTRKTARSKDVVDDAAIPHYSSIHFALQKDRRREKANIDNKIAIFEDTQQDGTDATLANLKAARAGFKDRKMEYARVNENAHVQPKMTIHNRYGVSGEAFFKKFVERANTHHGVNIADQFRR